MLAPQIKPAPLKKNGPGRWHLVVGDTLLEFQAPFMDIKGQPERLIEWATSGASIPEVPAMMLTGGTGLDRVVTGHDQGKLDDGAVTTTLRAYAEAHDLSLGAVRQKTNRASGLEKFGKGQDGADLFKINDLDALFDLNTSDMM